MNKRIIFIVLALLAIYQYTSRSAVETNFSAAETGPSAKEIDIDCDAVVFTTKTCPYCKEARELLNEKNVEWCEYDIEESYANNKLHKELGGNGVPLAIIGSRKLHGFNKSKYLDAISKI